MAKSTSLRGMNEIRTIAGTGYGSIPRVGESPYLRMHMLWTSNDRMRQEYACIEKRRLWLERRMKENSKASARLAQQSLPAQQQAGGTEVPSVALTTPRRPRRTKMSTKPVRY
jgi:hypothetical protein